MKEPMGSQMFREGEVQWCSVDVSHKGTCVPENWNGRNPTNPPHLLPPPLYWVSQSPIHYASTQRPSRLGHAGMIQTSGWHKTRFLNTRNFAISKSSRLKWDLIFCLSNSQDVLIVSHDFSIQWNLDLRKPDLRKNLDLRKIVGTTDFLAHKLFDLRKIF